MLGSREFLAKSGRHNHSGSDKGENAPLPTLGEQSPVGGCTPPKTPFRLQSCGLNAARDPPLSLVRALHTTSKSLKVSAGAPERVANCWAAPGAVAVFVIRQRAGCGVVDDAVVGVGRGAGGIGLEVA